MQVCIRWLSGTSNYFKLSISNRVDLKIRLGFDILVGSLGLSDIAFSYPYCSPTILYLHYFLGLALKLAMSMILRIFTFIGTYTTVNYSITTRVNDLISFVGDRAFKSCPRFL